MTQAAEAAAAAVEHTSLLDLPELSGMDGANFMDLLSGHMTMENLLLQGFMIAVSCLLGYVLARRLNAWIHSRTQKWDAQWAQGSQEQNAVLAGSAQRLQKFFAAVVRQVSFSLLSWLFMVFGSFLLVKTLDVGAQSLILARVATHILFAFAVVSLTSAFFTEMLGQRGIHAPGLQRLIKAVFWVLVILNFFGFLDDIIAAMETTKIPFGGANVTLWACLVALCTVLITLAAADWLADLADSFLAKSSLSPSLQLVFARIVRILLVIVAVIVALSTVGLDLSILSVFSGALGVGLGFGLQKIASNYVSGFIILLDRSVKIDDLVEVAGFRGRITQINTRFTVVRNNDGVECIVPNESFVTSVVQNFSYTEEASVQYISISVAYGADVRRALAIMLEEGMRERPRIVKDRRGWAYVDSFADSGINLKLGFWVQDPAKGTAGLKTEISLAIYDRFSKEGIEIPYNRLEVVLRDQKVPLKVDVADERAAAPKAVVGPAA